jgi:FixJ family two-component response regulator
MLTKELLKIRKDISIILSTGHGNSITDEKLKSLGIKGFIMKPYERRDIAETIRDVLGRK